jgi:hypothetical protein
MLLASAVSLIESSQKIGRSRHRHGPGRDIFPAVLRERFDLVMALDRSEEVRGYSTQIGADCWPVDPRHPVYSRGRGA